MAWGINPKFWGINPTCVENIVHFEAVGEHGNEIVKLNPKQDIVLINISTDQTELGWVAEVEKGIASDLEHRGDTGSVQCGMCSYFDGKAIRQNDMLQGRAKCQGGYGCTATNIVQIVKKFY
jgi:hypothetical protein